jgi:hypothetical protein
MTGLTATRILRTSLRLALTAFAIGMLLGMTATVASAAPGDAVPATLAAEHAPTDESPPAPTGPGGLTTCPEDQDCSPSEDPTEPVGDPDPDPDDGTAGHDIPVPTRIDTGRGGAAPAAWSWSLLGDVLLALAAGSVGAYAGARL